MGFSFRKRQRSKTTSTTVRQNVHKDTAIIVSGHCDFPAVPAAVAREVFRDILTAPEFVPHLLDVTMVRGEPSTVGAVWYERRQYGGRGEITVHKMAVSCAEEPYYSFSAASELVKAPFGVPNFSGTFTLSIHPSFSSEDNNGSNNSNDGCTIVYSNAFLTLGILARIVSVLCLDRLKREFQAHLDEELRYYYEEALRRTIARQQQEQTQELSSSSPTLTTTTQDVTELSSETSLE